MTVGAKVAQSCPTLCDPMDNTVRGILQARILEGVAFSFSRAGGFSPTQGSNPGLLHCRWILYQLSHKGSPRILEWVAYPFSLTWTWASCTANRFLTNWAIREAQRLWELDHKERWAPENWVPKGRFQPVLIREASGCRNQGGAEK